MKTQKGAKMATYVIGDIHGQIGNSLESPAGKDEIQ